MKKLLPLSLVVLLVVALAVPAFAAGTSFLTVEGTWKFNEVITRPEFVDVMRYEFVSGGTTFDGMDYHVLDEYKSYLAYFTGQDASGDHVRAYLYDNVLLDWNDWPQEEYRTITFTTPQTMLPYHHAWFTKNAVQVCDGSTCPATDVNKDNVCDDCGLEFAVLRVYEPFTVNKFMNHIGQIFTSAVSWVGNVGSTILQQPLLLAFTALPLCGLGIAVFRRLKETV